MSALGQYQPLSIQLGERLVSARSGRSRRELFFVWFRFVVQGTVDIDGNLYVLL